MIRPLRRELMFSPGRTILRQVTGAKITKSPEDLLSVRTDFHYVERRIKLIREMDHRLGILFNRYKGQLRLALRNSPFTARKIERTARTELLSSWTATYRDFVPKTIRLGIRKAKVQLGRDFIDLVRPLEWRELTDTVWDFFIKGQLNRFKKTLKDKFDIPLKFLEIERSSSKGSLIRVDPKILEELLADSRLNPLEYLSYLEETGQEASTPSEAIQAQLAEIDKLKKYFAQDLKVPGEYPTLEAVNEINRLSPTFALFWVSSRDRVTCISCMTLAGQAYSVGQLDPQGEIPWPGQFLNVVVGLNCSSKCRCFLRPITSNVGEQAPWLGRNFTTRGLAPSSDWSMETLTRILESPMRNSVKAFMRGLSPNYKQAGLFRGVAVVEFLSKAQIAIRSKHLQFLRGGGYLRTDGKLVMLIDDALPMYKKRLQLAEGLSAYRRHRDNVLVTKVFGEDLGAISRQLRVRELTRNKALRDALNPVEQGQWEAGTFTKRLLGKVQTLGRRGQLEFPWKVYVERADLHDFYMTTYLTTPQTFSKLPGARSFQDTLVSTSFDPDPIKKYMNRLWKGRTVPYKRNMTAGDLQRLEQRLLSKAIDDADRRVIRHFIQIIRRNPSLQRTEFFEHLTVILDSGKNPLNAIFGKTTQAGMMVPGRGTDIIPESAVLANSTVESLETVTGGKFTSALMISPGMDVAAIHELGHVVFTYNLSASARRKFIGIYRSWVAAITRDIQESLGISGALKRMTVRERATVDSLISRFNAVAKGKKSEIDSLLRGGQTVGDFQKEIEVVWTIFRKYNINTSTKFRPYVASSPDEFFADFFARSTLTPVSAQYLHPEAAQLFEWILRNDVLKEALPGIITPTSIRDRLRTFLLNMKATGKLGTLTDAQIEANLDTILQLLVDMDKG